MGETRLREQRRKRLDPDRARPIRGAFLDTEVGDFSARGTDAQSRAYRIEDRKALACGQTSSSGSETPFPGSIVRNHTRLDVLELEIAQDQESVGDLDGDAEEPGEQS